MGCLCKNALQHAIQPKEHRTEPRDGTAFGFNLRALNTIYSMPMPACMLGSMQSLHIIPTTVNREPGCIVGKGSPACNFALEFALELGVCPNACCSHAPDSHIDQHSWETCLSPRQAESAETRADKDETQQNDFRFQTLERTSTHADTADSQHSKRGQKRHKMCAHTDAPHPASGL